MSPSSIRAVIDQLVTLESPSAEALEQIFSTKLTASDDNPYWSTYDFEISDGPFETGDLRLSESDDRAHISLWSRGDLEVEEDDMELQSWGEVVDIRVNPRIPPEGTDTFVYLMNQVKVSVQLTHNSRQLHSVALDWGE